MRAVVERTWDGALLDRPEATLGIDPGDRTWRLSVDAVFHGDPPPGAPPGPTDRLWEHEVVELFLVGEGERYTEIELGPHGHHLVLQLEGVRNVVRSLLPITYTTRIEGGRWWGEAQVDASLIPPPRRWNAYAIHGRGARRTYCAAVPVPGAQPDFHRLGCFAAWPS